MKKNNRGLSTVVTTLIIILLVLVAVGIIWGVVNNLLNKSSGTIESSTQCFDIDVKATKVLNNSVHGVDGDDDYLVTLKRGSMGGDKEIYAKLVFSSPTETSVVYDFDTGLTPLASATLPFDDVMDNADNPVENATKIEVTPYYLDESGSEALCSITSELEFELQPKYY